MRTLSALAARARLSALAVLLLSLGRGDSAAGMGATAVAAQLMRGSVGRQNAPERVRVAYSKLPMSFEVNEGQTDRRVRFLSRGRGYSLFLTSTEAVVTLRRPITRSVSKDVPPENMSTRADSGESTASVLRMKLVGAKTPAEISGVDPLLGKSH